MYICILWYDASSNDGEGGVMHTRCKMSLKIRRREIVNHISRLLNAVVEVIALGDRTVSWTW